jgi:Voltage gated chloride channel
LGMAAHLSGVTQAPLTATVISMELTANQQMVLPIMATCLLARAASSILSRKPVYRALADKLIEGYEHELARRANDAERAAGPDDDLSANGADTALESRPMVEDPATPIPPAPDHSDDPSPHNRATP